MNSQATCITIISQDTLGQSCSLAAYPWQEDQQLGHYIQAEPLSGSSVDSIPPSFEVECLRSVCYPFLPPSLYSECYVHNTWLHLLSNDGTHRIWPCNSITMNLVCACKINDIHGGIRG